MAVEPVGPGVRVDAGVTSGDEVTLHYDPMIAKLVVLGEDRADAIGKMRWALRHYVILGDVVTNIPFLSAVLAHPRFQDGDTTTDFVEQAFGGWLPDAVEAPALALVAAAVGEYLRTDAAGQGLAAALPAGDLHTPWQATDGFRIGGT